MDRLALALYQPDIPQNTGTILRMGACLDVAVHIIEPAGFRLDDPGLKRAGLDYLERAALIRHRSWDAFRDWQIDAGRRLILLTTRAPLSYSRFAFEAGDVLLLGRESEGAPDTVHEAAEARVTIPMQSGTRSLNVAVAAAMVLGEALRQTSGYLVDDI